jgi:hypothetical protein
MKAAANPLKNQGLVFRKSGPPLTASNAARSGPRFARLTIGYIVREFCASKRTQVSILKRIETDVFEGGSNN